MEFNKDKWIKDGKILNMPKKQKDKYELFVYLASICFDERKYIVNISITKARKSIGS